MTAFFRKARLPGLVSSAWNSFPAKPQEVSKVMVKIPNIKPGKPEVEFERTVVQAMALPCSTIQAVYKQRQADSKVA